MSRIRIIGLTLVAVFAVSAVGVASASGAEYVYKVAGAKLVGAKEITSKAKTTYILKGEALGVKTTVECPTQKLSAGAAIKGGEPGTSEETVVFEGCKPTAPAECVGKKVKVENTPVKNEIVTVVKPAAKVGKLATLFTPKAGTLFTTITFEGCLFNTKAEVTGTAAALDSPGKVEQKVGTLIFEEGAEEITEVECLKETVACISITKNKLAPFRQKVELKFAGNRATLKGQSEVELVSKEVWGVF